MDLKEFISKLDKAGDLVRIKRPVSTKYEIAAIMELDSGTVKAHMARALKKLREELRDLYVR